MLVIIQIAPSSLKASKKKKYCPWQPWYFILVILQSYKKRSGEECGSYKQTTTISRFTTNSADNRIIFAESVVHIRPEDQNKPVHFRLVHSESLTKTNFGAS